MNDPVSTSIYSRWWFCDAGQVEPDRLSGVGFWTLEDDMSRATKRKYKGVYQVVFDGSGTIGQHRGVVYAGGVSTLVQWQAFSETWENILIKHDLAYFKMAEANTFYGEFAPKYTEWGDQRNAKRDALVTELASLKRRYDLRVNGCGFVIGTAGTSPFDPGASVIEKKKQLFQGAMLALLRAIPADCAVMILCDIEKDVEETFRGWIEGLARTESEKVARVVGISFYDDKFAQPIQFADMVAFIARQEIERRLVRPDDEVNPLYPLLVGDAEATFEPIGRDGLLSGLEVSF